MEFDTIYIVMLCMIFICFVNHLTPEYFKCVFCNPINELFLGKARLTNNIFLSCGTDCDWDDPKMRLPPLAAIQHRDGFH